MKVNLVAFVCFCIFDKGLEGMFSLVQGGKKGLVKQVRGISYLPKQRKKKKKKKFGVYWGCDVDLLLYACTIFEIRSSPIIFKQSATCHYHMQNKTNRMTSHSRGSLSLTHSLSHTATKSHKHNTVGTPCQLQEQQHYTLPSASLLRSHHSHHQIPNN